MAHHLDHPIGSDLSFAVLRKRQDDPEDSTNHRLYPGAATFDAFIADPDTLQPDPENEHRNGDLFSLGIG